MMQQDLFGGGGAVASLVAPSPPLTLADPEDVALVALSLPAETRVSGERRCRHHPEQAIPVRGAPCVECRAAGRGVGGVVATTEVE